MTSKPKIKPLTSENLPAFGEVLQHRFITDYPNLIKNPDYDNPKWWSTIVYPAIQKIYEELKLNLDEAPRVQSNDYRIGDLVITNDKHYYSVTGLSGGEIRTFPTLRYPDSVDIDPLTPSQSNTVVRPNIFNVPASLVEEFIFETIPEILEQEDIDGGTFEASRLVGRDSGNLQIGDLIFSVDPIQISFSTQNGYHFFPTIRTNGQPKLPTMQQIKNIHVVLIFPNEDAINNQLIPLFAMYKRTPFVNIKNKDISAFFQDIKSPNGWIPVALEGIHIQTIEGFPNSLQAEVSLLPFESRFLGGAGFRALRSMNDVALQQQYLIGDQQEQMLEDRSRYSMRNEQTFADRWEDLVDPGVRSTENFKESVPFRAFYQSLIEGRKTVKDEYGEDEQIRTINNVNVYTAKDITAFSPTRRENMLRYYTADHNRGLLSFTYRFVQGDLRELQRSKSFERLDDDSERLKETINFIDKVKDYKGLSNVMFASFHDYSDALRDFEYAYGRSENIINQVLAMHGYNTTVVEPPNVEDVPVVGQLVKKVPLLTIFNFIYRSLLHSTNVAQFYTAFRNLAESDIQNFPNNNSSVYQLLSSNSLIYNDINLGEVSTYGIKSIDQAFRELWNWIEEDTTGRRKKDIFLIMDNIAKRIKGDLEDMVVLEADPKNPGNTYYAKRSLPMVQEEVVIDNMQDVVRSWNLSYSNKFVPIHLESFKYPFYQHVGSNDAQIGLNVISTDGQNDLKSNLSTMSDRIYDSVKLIMHHAPELYTWLDPRIQITAQPNHFLYAFGIRHVILNSSNSTNIQGKPNAWMTNISLTQAHFNLDQYHSLESKRSTSDIEAVLTRLLPRIKFNNGIPVVRKYNYASSSGDEDLSFMMFMSFIDSSAGSRFLENFTKRLQEAKPTRPAFSILGFLRFRPQVEVDPSLPRTASGLNITGNELAQIVLDRLGQLSDLDLKSNDDAATSEIQDVINRYPRFGEIMKATIASYESLLEREADALLNLIDIEKSKIELVVTNAIPSLRNVGIASAAEFLGILLLSLVIPGGIFLSITTGVVSTGTRLYQAVQLLKGVGEGYVQLAFQELRDRMALFFSSMIENYKREILLNLAHAIVRDPPIRDILLSPTLVYAGRDPGNEGVVDLRELIRRRDEQSSFQCYKDFDIPLSKELGGKRRKRIKLSPDFYLLSVEESRHEALTFVKDNTERLLKVGKLQMMSTLVDHKAMVERFDNLIESLGVQRDEEGNADLQSVDQFGFTVLTRIAKELDYDRNLENSYIEIFRRYNVIAKQDSNLKLEGDLDTEIDMDQQMFLDQSKVSALMDEYDKANSERTNDPLYQRERKFVETYLKLGIAPKMANRDIFKLNFIWAQRMLTLIEILEIYTAIISYLSQKPIYEQDIEENFVSELFKKLSNLRDKQILGNADNQLQDMRRHVGVILKNYDVIRTDSLDNDEGNSDKNIRTLSDSDKKAYKELLDKYNGGVYTASKDSGSLNLPEIRVLQNHLYNKIGYYIRLNTAIDHYNGQIANGKAPTISLDSLPEIKFLDYWNVRAAEANFRKLEILKQYEESLKRRKRPTMRLFPTFKLFFIEEDGGRTQLLDDYYAYNAVQSIEIVKNKSFASTTAVIRLSNLMGTITDQFAFHRERNDYTLAVNPEAVDEAFFGTLDVKPGTRVQIKMGYSADDRELETVFNGRIIEMNAGPMTEMVCQSFGAQLNNEIYAHKFGLLASEKEHGDIASAILDMIPGLEMLGNKDIVNLGLLSGFSGKDLKKMRKNLFDKYLMTNILGRTSATLLNTDNPRDENIYLPFDLSPYPEWKPKFTWIVYQQSVWDALREIALYHRSVCVTVRPYNDDPISTRADRRETLVIGDKSGYYKYTDSYSLSSIDTDKIQDRVQQWNDIIGSNVFNIPNFINSANRAPSSNVKSFNALNGYDDFFSVFDNTATEFLDRQVRSNIDVNIKITPDEIARTRLRPEFVNAWNFLSDKLNAVILSKHLADTLNIEIRSIGDLAKEAVINKIKQFGTPVEKTIDVLHQIANGSNYEDPNINDITDINKMKAFQHFIYLYHYFRRTDLRENNESKNTGATFGPSFWSLTPDEFYSVRVPVDNKNKTLLSDPRYRKIQQHHLVTDSYNMISNDISLNSAFGNMVNLWYFDNPDFISINGIPADKWEDLNVWTTKAFRDTRDEHSRPINSFQKNIDINWKDIATANNDFFGGYKRISVQDLEEKDGNEKGKVKPEILGKLVKGLNPDFGDFNLNRPDWRMFPSYVQVGVNLLKREVQTMYRGAIQIIGDVSIEPLDIIHLADYTNDMHGAFEVEEVIHTFTPENGMRTTITPLLITYERDPIQLEDVGVINRIYDRALKNRAFKIGQAVAGVGLTAGGIISAAVGAWPTSLALGSFGVPMAYNGIMGSTLTYHKFLYEQMGNILGGDVINFTALISKGAPFMCGFDGLDYAGLKTVINHQVEGVTGFINRLSAFSDPFNTMFHTNWNPQDYGPGKLIMDNLGLGRFGELSHIGKLNGLTVWDKLNPISDFTGF